MEDDTSENTQSPIPNDQIAPTQDTPAEQSESSAPASPPASPNRGESQGGVEQTPVTDETAQVVIPASPAGGRQPEANPSTGAQGKSILSGILLRCKEVIAGKKQKKLEKILQFAKQKNKITNDDVQKLILVSDKTAGRYLSELAGQGKLKRVGSTSQIYYELPS